MYCPAPYVAAEHETWDRMLYEVWYCAETDIYFFTNRRGGCGATSGLPDGWSTPARAIPAAAADYRAEIETQVIDPCYLAIIRRESPSLDLITYEGHPARSSQRFTSPGARDGGPTLAERVARRHLITYRVPWKGTVPQRVRIPPGKLSLQPVAIGADDGGNDIVRSTSV